MKTDDLIGIPYVRHGRTRDGFDCWGLVLEVLRRRGIDASDVFAREDQETVKMLQDGTPSDLWIAQLFPGWRRVEAADLGDVVVFRDIDGDATHAGVLVTPAHFLHTMKRTGTVLTRLTREPWATLLCGVYRHDG